MAAIAKPARRMWPQLQPVQTLYCLVNQFVPQRVGNQVCSCSVVLESHEIRSVPVPTGLIAQYLGSSAVNFTLCTHTWVRARTRQLCLRGCLAKRRPDS